MMTSQAVEIITVNQVDKCRLLCERILQEKAPVAMDAKGVDLGAEGRLTLLQLATGDGRVYLIDVVDHANLSDTTKGKELLEKGKVKDVLESEEILKIIHDCSSVSAALFHQFHINIRNVFDTQVFDQAIETNKGVKFPKRLNLQTIIEKYGSRQHTCKDFKSVWLSDSEYWLKRPLSAEAIQYAAEDVRVLHQLNDTMKKKTLLDPEGLKIYRDFLDLQINEAIEAERSRVKEVRKKRDIENAKQMLRNKGQFQNPKYYSEDHRRAVITYRKYKYAFKRCGLNQETLQRIDNSMASHDLDACIALIEHGEHNAVLNGSHKHVLTSLIYHPNDDVSKNALEWQKKARIAFMRVKLVNVDRKFSEGHVCRVKDLREDELQALRWYQQYNQHVDTPELSDRIDILEKELSASDVDQFEKKLSEGNMDSRKEGNLNILRRHCDPDIRNRAVQVFKDIRIREMKNQLKDLQDGINMGDVIDVDDLTDEDKRALQTLTEFKDDVHIDVSDKVFELECDVIRENLDKWESLKEKGKFDLKKGAGIITIIKSLKNHPHDDIRRRAINFERVRQSGQTGNRGRGGHRGRGRGRGGRR